MVDEEHEVMEDLVKKERGRAGSSGRSDGRRKWNADFKWFFPVC